MCRAVAFVVIVAIVAATAGWLYRSTAQEQTSFAAGAEGGKAVEKVLTSRPQIGGRVYDAFNSGDAKLIGSFWTPDGEYTSPEGDKLLGASRDWEGAYAEFFVKLAQGNGRGDVETIRMLGKHTARRGTLTLKIPGDKSHGTSQV